LCGEVSPPDLDTQPLSEFGRNLSQEQLEALCSELTEEKALEWIAIISSSVAKNAQKSKNEKKPLD
jgi:hypothetical protein